MSDLRGDPRPSMVNPYGAPIPSTHVAETWRPEGSEGEVMVIVSERFEITETMKDGHNRVEFPIGTYLIPMRIRRKVRAGLTPEGEYVEAERVLNIGGVDEASMHWALRYHKVKHSSHQPALYAAPLPPAHAPDPEPGPFCSQCGTHRSLGHTEECPLYVPGPEEAAESLGPGPGNDTANLEEPNRRPVLLEGRASTRQSHPVYPRDRRR